MIAGLNKLAVRITGDATGLISSLRKSEHHIVKSTEAINKQAAKTGKRFNSAGREIDEMGRYVKRADSLLKRLGKTLSKVGGYAKSAGSKMKSMGRSMVIGVTLPLAAFGGFAVKSFADFDKAMIESTSIMGDVTDHFDAMVAQATALSDKGPKSAVELAESYYFLASAGMSAEASLAALPAVTDFAIAGAFDMALATDLLTDSLSALGLASKDPQENLHNLTALSDALVKGATLANSSVQQLAEALTNDAGTAAKNFGMDMNTTIAVLSRYADVGKKGAEAGSLLGRAVRLTSAAYLDNAQVFEKYGIDVVNKATGEYNDFIEIIGDMENAFKDLSGPQKSAALSQLGFAALAQKSILPLIGASEAMEEYRTKLEAAGGTTSEVAEKQMKALWNQVAMVKNQIVNTARETAALFVPVYEKVLSVVSGAVMWFRNLSEGTRKVIAGIAAIVAIGGPLLIMFGSFVALIGGIVAGITALAPVIAAVVSTTTLWIAAIGGVVAALVGLFAYVQGADGLLEIWNSMVKYAETAFIAITGFIMNFGENMRTVLSYIQKNWWTIIKELGGAWFQLQMNMVSNVAVAFKAAFRIIMAIAGKISKLWESVFNGDLIKAVWNGLKAAGEMLLKFAQKAWETIKNIFKGKETDLTMDDLLGQMAKDADAGAEDLGKAIGTIMKESFDEMKIFDGVQMDLPPLDLNLEGGEEALEKVKNSFEKIKELAGFKPPANELTADMEKTLTAISAVEEKLKEQIATFGMTSDEIELYKLGLAGATEGQLVNVKKMQAELRKLSEEAQLKDAAKNLVESLKTPEQKADELIGSYQKMLDAGLITMETFDKAVAKAKEGLGEDITMKFNVTGVEAVEAGSAEALARYNEFMALKPVEPKIEGFDLAQEDFFAQPTVEMNMKAKEAVLAEKEKEQQQKAKEGINKLADDTIQMVKFLQQIVENTNTDNKDIIELAQAGF